MAKHNNPSIVERCLRIFNTKFDNVSDDVTGIIANVEIIPNTTYFIHTTRTTSGSGNVTTIPSTKKTYLTNISYEYVKDATCDNADGTMTVTVNINGTSTALLTVPILTLTAQTQRVNLAFKNPILVDKGAVVSFSSTTFTAGKLSRMCSLYGYQEEE